jgi:hypothetical protein
MIFRDWLMVKIARRGRFGLVFVNKFDGTISVAGVFSILKVPVGI